MNIKAYSLITVTAQVGKNSALTDSQFVRASKKPSALKKKICLVVGIE